MLKKNLQQMLMLNMKGAVHFNGKYRNLNNIDLLKKIIDSLVNFIHQYNTYINR